jgi:hypothetical protein
LPSRIVYRTQAAIFDVLHAHLRQAPAGKTRQVSPPLTRLKGIRQEMASLLGPLTLKRKPDLISHLKGLSADSGADPRTPA